MPALLAAAARAVERLARGVAVAGLVGAVSTAAVGVSVAMVLAGPPVALVSLLVIGLV